MAKVKTQSISPPYTHPKLVFVLKRTKEQILKVYPVPYKHKFDLKKLIKLVK